MRADAKKNPSSKDQVNVFFITFISTLQATLEEKAICGISLKITLKDIAVTNAGSTET